MGNIDSRSHHSCGYMVVQTSQPIYNPGTPVSGSIYLRITAVCAPREILIDVKGVEKVSWKDRETHNVDGRQETREVKRRDKRDIFRYKNPCFAFTLPQLMPGDYSIPFSFMMPANLPSSF
jgi:hypothetical protein